MKITEYHIMMIEQQRFIVTYYCRKCFRFFCRKDLMTHCYCGDPLFIVELEARR